ncbi:MULTISPECIES: GDP-mannose 4,6-dehydratase [unclassified Bradyrhizobium]|uniref:GDP-mannose 4,6-dehydratase n=1 Tax=unclassified Bradyrhizobium TaxID=2631580 RepID=UPI00291645A7|nr:MULTISPECIES: GDP-mannose 4,6-dehydratase [unclassified Bradyrhizobium]
MSRRVLITGATGQDGRYLIELLRGEDCEIHAQTRGQPPQDPHGVVWHRGNLVDLEFLTFLCVELKPDEIYNLAAQSRPIRSWESPRDTTQINAIVPQSICELLVRYNPTARLFQATSSEIYGECMGEFQSEETACLPLTPYGIAKLYAHHAIGAFRRQYGLHASSGILFNHESPYRPVSFVSQKIAHGAAAIACGLDSTDAVDDLGFPIVKDGVLSLGNLAVRRDFGFARDYVEAMRLMVRHTTPGDYVVGTGLTHSIEEFCETAFAAVGLDWRDHVKVDSSMIRKTDSHFTCASAWKITRLLGWRPSVTFQELVTMMVRAQMDLLRSKPLCTEVASRTGTAE